MDTNCGEFFKKYFDLERDYGAIKRKISEVGVLNGSNVDIQAALRYGHGIRLLNQDPLETVISFIISANNNIPRIKGIIERLCGALGEDMGGYRAFPTVDALADASEEFYSSIGAGYRAPFIKKTAQTLRDGFNLAELCRNNGQIATDDARRKLMSLAGVGRKVADCILLFGLGRRDVFPIDVWTERVFRDIYMKSALTDRAKMSDRLTELFGDAAGYAQQYLFYERRNRKMHVNKAGRPE